MKAIFFSTESWHPAGQRIMDCFMWFEERMRLSEMSEYCDMLDVIGIIPWSGPEKYMGEWKDRRYISWQRREADMRLQIDFEMFIHAPLEEQRAMVKQNIVDSLLVVKKRCDAKKYRFDLERLMTDVFPQDEE